MSHQVYASQTPVLGPNLENLLQQVRDMYHAVLDGQKQIVGYAGGFEWFLNMSITLRRLQQTKWKQEDVGKWQAQALLQEAMKKIEDHVLDQEWELPPPELFEKLPWSFPGEATVVPSCAPALFGPSGVFMPTGGQMPRLPIPRYERQTGSAAGTGSASQQRYPTYWEIIDVYNDVHPNNNFHHVFNTPRPIHLLNAHHDPNATHPPPPGHTLHANETAR